jgi:UDP-3-O-[3-hydroxymyristoyl] glucosamine N-acyltransferase
MRDIEPGATVGGSPAVPIMDYHRQTASLSKLARKKEK